jgi:hypothetical protein
MAELAAGPHAAGNCHNRARREDRLRGPYKDSARRMTCPVNLADLRERLNGPL